MKKFLLITLLFLVSCTYSADQQELQQSSSDLFHKVEYEGHSYIFFIATEGYAGYAGLEHDPDCPCLKEKNNVNNFAMSQQFNIFAKHKTPISNI